MKKLYYLSYIFYLDGGRVGHGDIRMECNSTGDRIELSWETIESFKDVITQEVAKSTGYTPQSVFLTLIQPLDEHDKSINMTVDAKIGAK